MSNEREWRTSDWDMPPLYAELYARNQELERQLQEARALLAEAGQDANDGSLLARAASIITCPTCYSADETEAWQLDRMAYQTKLRVLLADKEPAE